MPRYTLYHTIKSQPLFDCYLSRCPAEDTVTVNRTLPLHREGFSFDAFRFINEFSGVAEVKKNVYYFLKTSSRSAFLFLFDPIYVFRLYITIPYYLYKPSIF